MPHCLSVQADSPTGNIQACSVWRRPASAHEEESRLAKRRANLALAMGHFGEFDSVHESMQGGGALDCRAYVTAHAAELISTEPLVQMLRAAQSPAEQSRLLRLVGGYSKQRFTADDQAYLNARIPALATSSGHASVKSAALWCASQWQMALPDADVSSRQPAGSERNWQVNSIGQTLIVVPAGEKFLMGSPQWEPHHEDSESRQWARIDRSFAISATETTQGQFRDFLADERIKRLYASERHRPAFTLDPHDSRPQTVSWRDAVRFCQWLTEREGLPESEWCYPGVLSGNDSILVPVNYLERIGYRLPREMEWECAARAGTNEMRYCGSDDDVLAGYEWFMPKSRGSIHRVALLRPNDWGFFDMLGNAFEWCDDLQGPYRRVVDSQFRDDLRGNPKFPKESDKCVIRSASAASLADRLRAANRTYQWIDYHSPTTGFRVARTIRP